MTKPLGKCLVSCWKKHNVCPINAESLNKVPCTIGCYLLLVDLSIIRSRQSYHKTESIIKPEITSCDDGDDAKIG